ncbi:MAG TPA: IS66 family insertion sequence element accessory protein TnpB [Gammaproteobacteria bacterium]|nr:IS66 family insertion sequence element accessory protein TnpB [Gammaproteobacteria bacterium]
MLMPNDIKIYFYTQPVDMRKSIDTLCVLVSEVLKMNPTEGYLFLFRSKSGNKLKALHYETNCFTLWYRRLEKGKFVFQKNSHDCIEMSQEHFKWLLASDKYSRREAFEGQNIAHFS